MKRLHFIYYIVFALWLILPTCAFSQVSLRQAVKSSLSQKVGKANQGIRDNIPATKKSKARPSRQATSAKNSSSTKCEEAKPDTVYAFQTKKQHGWFAPLGTLSKEQVAHRNTSIRFTCRNAKGHWCKMETINSLGGYSTGLFSPYILKLNAADTDSLANAEWAEKIKTACIYEFIADPTGETIIQERAYDEDMNIVYIYSRTPIGKDKNGHNRFIGSYKDSYGMPAEMRNDSTYTYGTLVRLTEDQWGNDSIIEYLDAKGLSKRNSDGVAIEAYIYNAKGEFIKQQSRDSKGNLVVDNWGNCGVLYSYNKDLTISSATYMDDKWHPMRMPKGRASAKESVMQTQYTYDKYHREIEEAYFLIDGTPDTNKYGAHKVKYEYDTLGNMISETFYDINDSLICGNGSHATFKAEYDEKTGNPIDVYWYDETGKPIIGPDYLCRVHYEYDNDGQQILKEQYCFNDDKEYLWYKNEKTPLQEYTQWSDGSYRIDSIDAKGRTTFTGFYSKDGRPEMTSGRASERYWYKDNGKISVSTEIDFDEKGMRVDVDGICETVTKADSTLWTLTKWRYNAAGILQETFVHRYTPYFETLIGQNDANTYGVVSRSGGASSVRCYKGEIMRSHKGGFSSIYGRDEFGETDYIDGSSELYCYSKMFPNAETKFYDEHNNEVADVDSLRNAIPKVMTIEVMDSAAYKHGLRDNDVILFYGDYIANLDSIKTYYNFRTEWALRSVLDAKKNKKMVVFRIEDASKSKYGLVEIDNLVGTTSEIGFLAHIRFLTQKQKERIKQSIETNMSSDSPLLTREDLTRVNNKGGNNYIVLAYTDMYRSRRNYPYAKQVTDPAILLGACFKGRNMKWTNGDVTDDFEAIRKAVKSSDSKYPAREFFLTKDAINIKTMELTEYAAWTNWFDTHISDEDFGKISTLYAQAKDSIELLCKKSSSIGKNLVGYWETRRNEADPYPVTGYLNFTKKGEMEGKISNYGYRKYSDAFAIFKITKSFSGNWSTADDWLFLPDYSDYENVSLECINIKLVDKNDEQNENARNYINSHCNTNKRSFLDSITLWNTDINSNVYVDSIDKNMFIVSDSIVFIKKKSPKDLIRIAQEKMSSSRNANEIDNAQKLIIGKWQTEIPEIPQSNMELTFSDNDSTTLDMQLLIPQEYEDSVSANVKFKLQIKGIWYIEDNSVNIQIDTTSFVSTIDVDVVGVDDEQYKERIKEEIIKNYELQKEQFIASLSEENPFSGRKEITRLNSTELVLDTTTFIKRRDIVLGRIEGDKGYMVEQGYSGLFIILQWCDWNCTQLISDFSSEFNKRKNKGKSMLLLPVENVNNEDVFKDVIHCKFPAGLVGLRIIDVDVSEQYYQQQILQRYIDWRNNNR